MNVLRIGFSRVKGKDSVYQCICSYVHPHAPQTSEVKIAL